MAWAALILVIGLAAVGAWAWYFSHHLLVATEDQKRRVLRRGAAVSVGVHVTILLVGVVAFAVTGDNWLVLAAIWLLPLLYLALLTVALRRARPRPGQPEPPR